MVNPYLSLIRFDKPVGSLLLAYPGWWALLLASEGDINWWLVLWFGLGAFVMRSAGCVVNDLWDSKIDAQVERTKNRPLASGALSVQQALLILGILLVLGLTILLQLPPVTWIWGIAALIPVAVYPLMKRFFPLPQLFLGLTFNWGALMGWVTVTQSWPPVEAWILYAACVCWTLAYDTAYAYQDKADDETVGVHSAALLFGDKGKVIVLLLYSLFVIGFSLATKDLVQAGMIIIVGVVYVLYMAKRFHVSDVKECAQIFKDQAYVGAALTYLFI